MDFKCVFKKRNYEQPNDAQRRDAGDRTHALRRRTLYNTTANQVNTPTKKPLGCGIEYTNNTNGDLLLDVSRGNYACLRYSYSHAAQLDAALGKSLSQAKCATAAQLHNTYINAGKNIPPRSLFETSQSITSYTNVFTTDVSYNGGKQNQITYDSNNRLDSDDKAFPGIIVDPSRNVFIYPQHMNPYVDVCSNELDLCLNSVRNTTVPQLLRNTANSIIMDACFGFPLRTMFVP